MKYNKIEELERVLASVVLLAGHGSLDYENFRSATEFVIVAIVWDDSGFNPGAAISVETSGYSTEDAEIQGAFEDLEEHIISHNPEYIEELTIEWGDRWSAILTEGWGGQVFVLPWADAVNALLDDKYAGEFIDLKDALPVPLKTVLKDNPHAEKDHVRLMTLVPEKDERFNQRAIYRLNRAGHKASYLFDDEFDRWVLGTN